MANYILKEMPGEMTEGKTIVYPKMQTYSRHDHEQVIHNMRVYANGIGEGIIRAVFDALAETMATWMPLGHTMKIDGLGVFSLSLGFDTSTASEKAEMKKQEFDDDADPKLKYRHVCIKGINFKPDPELLKEMNRQAIFDRVGVDVEVAKTSKYTREERLAKAKEIIRSRGYMTLTDYALATRQSRTTASNDLKRMVADPDSGITTRGQRPHKIWIEKLLFPQESCE